MPRCVPAHWRLLRNDSAPPSTSPVTMLIQTCFFSVQ
jgi:hypothetical protein